MIIYRKAESGDLDDVDALVQEAIKTMDSQGINQWDEVYPARIHLEDDILSDEMYIGIMEGQIAVIFVLNKRCDIAYREGKWADPGVYYSVLHRLCVNPAFQNRGVGRQTMEYIEELLRNMDIHAIRLDVFSQNPYAMKLYEGLGYQKTGTAQWRKGLFYLMEKYI